jgi:ribosomal protein S12 methylthiotransferase accessory factor
MSKQIVRFRNIFTELGFVVSEQVIPSDIPCFISVQLRLFVKNRPNFSIDTLGNGTNREGALASAYGEMVERIQNDAFFLNTHYLQLAKEKDREGELYERIRRNGLAMEVKAGSIASSFQDLNEMSRKILMQCFGLSSWDKLLCQLEHLYPQKHLELSEFSVNGRNEDRLLLPLGIMQNHSSVNGMAAGVTREQAILRGVFEVLEKYIIWRLYENSNFMTSSSIVMDDSMELCAAIDCMESYGYAVRFYDCSYDFSIPIVGALVIDRTGKRQAFTVAADVNEAKARLRALSRIFKVEGESKFLDYDYFGEILPDKKKHEYFKNITRGNGRWPFVFSSFEQSLAHKSSIKIDSEALIEELNRKGLEVLVRDVNSVGVPSVYVYIPGMSEIVYRMDKSDYFEHQIAMQRNMELLEKQDWNGRCFQHLLEASNNIYSFDPRYLIPYHNNQEMAKKDLSLLLASMAAFANDLPQAEMLLQNYSVEAESDKEEEAFALQFLAGRVHENNSGKDWYKQRILDQEVSSKYLESPSNYFNQKDFLFPFCPHCDRCPIEKDCFYLDVMSLYCQYQLNKTVN